MSGEQMAESKIQEMRKEMVAIIEEEAREKAEKKIEKKVKEAEKKVKEGIRTALQLRILTKAQIASIFQVSVAYIEQIEDKN